MELCDRDKLLELVGVAIKSVPNPYSPDIFAGNDKPMNISSERFYEWTRQVFENTKEDIIKAIREVVE